MILQHRDVTCIFLLALACRLLPADTESKTLQIVPDPNVSAGMEPQFSLDQGLRALQSGMTLVLHSGTHMVHNLTFVRDLRDVTIQGMGSARDTIISCQPGIGLAFFNIMNLQIRNVTVDKCGLNRQSWDRINTTLYDAFDMLFQIPRVVRVGLLLAACRDVILERCEVQGTKGIGMLAMSLLGSTQLRDVQFENNSPPACVASLDNFINQNYHDWIGGGAYFLYQDLKTPIEKGNHNLTIVNSRFERNVDCSIVVLLENYIERSADLVNLGYQIGAGGGLSVMMAQRDYSVSMSVRNSRFMRNYARNGGGVHVGVFSGVPPQTTIQFVNTMFSDNGDENITSNGGGMIIYIDLIRPSELSGDEREIEDVEGSVYVDIQNSQFSKNNANSGGGVAIVSHYAEQHVFDSSNQVRMDGCRFDSNRAFGGAALLVYERKSSGFDTGLQLLVSNCRFERNSIEFGSSFEVGHIQDYGTVHVRSVNMTLSGTVSFVRNQATALGAVSSVIFVMGNVLFERNRAVNGAAMQLTSLSLLIPQKGANIRFINNKAELYGGAIYVKMQPDNFTFIPDDCFLYFDKPGYGLCANTDRCLPDKMNISITFRDNDARVGSMVFGSALQTCPWVQVMKASESYNHNMTVFENLHRSNRSFSFDEPPRNPMLVSTETLRLQVQERSPLSVMPGEEFQVEVTAHDAFDQSVSEVITSNVIGLEPGDPTLSLIGDFGYFELRPPRKMSTPMSAPMSAPISVLGEENQTLTIRLFTIDFGSEVFIDVELTNCVTGYTHNSQRCVCDEQLESLGVTCNLIARNFTVGRGKWLGPVRNRGKISNDDLTVASCVLNYCEDGEKEVVSGEWDSQCAAEFHRAGTLCGRCEDGYSVQLGTNRCAKCDHWSLFLLVLFIAAGLFVVYATVLLQISVAEGFFSAILFYSNIISLYSVYFNSTDHLTGINFLTSFFTLNFGIEACLYDGMDSLAVIALQLVFVVYVFVLVVIHILIDKKLPLKCMDSIHQRYSPSKMLATLIILCYVSILQASIGILSFTIIETLNNELYVMWYIDPTVRYFHGFHAFLCIVALILFFLYILPLPIMLTFCSRAIYRWRYFNKLKPLYDALYAPFKVKFRPWLGLQLIVRIVLFIFAYFVPSPHQLLVLGVCLLVYLYFQTVFQPYNSKLANLLESTLIAIALLYDIIALYFGNLASYSTLAVILTITFLTGIAYCVIIAGFVSYLLERYPNILKSIKKAFRRKGRENGAAEGDRSNNMESPMHPKIRVVDSLGAEVIDTSGRLTASAEYLNRIRTNSPQELEVSFTEFREPLLDEGELEVHTAYSVVIASQRNPGRPRRASSLDTLCDRVTDSSRTERYSNGGLRPTSGSQV